MTRCPTTLLAASALLLAVAALAQPPPAPEPMSARLARVVALDAGQLEAMRAVEDRTVQEVIAVRGRIAYARHQLRRMLDAAEPDRDVLLAKVDEIARLHGELHRVRLSARLDALALLTAGQREQLARARAERRERRPAWPVPGR
jgi:Spy/CpxP family protein refolding chaperone